MTLYRSVAIALLALVAQPVWAQNFSQLKAGGPPTKATNVAQAVYASLSDQSDTNVSQAAFQSLNDQVSVSNQPTSIVAARISDNGVQNIPASAATDRISDLGFAADNGAIRQTGLLGPSCGVPSCTDPACGLPGGPACGLPAASCGLPSGPACGLPSGPACGLPSGPACGLPSGPGCGLPEVSCGLPSIGSGGGCLSKLFGGSSCDDGCDSCGSVPCGSLCTRNCAECCGVGTHYSRVYGDVLYIRARKAEVPYAVEADGPVAAGSVPLQMGAIGLLDSDYDLGFRAGVNIALDTVSSIDIRYTFFESETDDELSSTSPDVVRSMVSHPSTQNAAVDVLSSVANLDIDFQIIDLSYRHLWKCCDLFSANYVVGARYADFDQEFDVDFVKNVDESVQTDIDFEGAGLRIGLETQRFSCRNQLHVYANGYASLLSGQFRGHYFQGNNFDGTEVDVRWEAGRVVPILDFEAGVGWNSLNNKLSVSAGYMVSAWFNSVRTSDFINAVQTNNYLDLCDSIWFDGLQARVSYSF